MRGKAAILVLLESYTGSFGFTTVEIDHDATIRELLEEVWTWASRNAPDPEVLPIPASDKEIIPLSYYATLFEVIDEKGLSPFEFPKVRRLTRKHWVRDIVHPQICLFGLSRSLSMADMIMFKIFRDKNMKRVISKWLAKRKRR
jgi:hypothetical protein